MTKSGKGLEFVGENQYFQKALGDFVQEAAYGGAVRHLTDKGYTVKQIMEQLDFPAPYEKVRQAVWERLRDTGVILLQEPGKDAREEKASYVKEYDRYGKITFRRVPGSREEAAPICWKEHSLAAGKAELMVCLKAKLEENGEAFSYASWDFGRVAAKEPEQYKRLLNLLAGEKEYVEELPWERCRVYHRLNHHMWEILTLLIPTGLYQGECFFLKTGDRIKIVVDREIQL